MAGGAESCVEEGEKMRFYDYYIAEGVVRDRMRERLQKAERKRLIRQGLAGGNGPNRFHRRALAGLGHRLVTWGCRLEGRYGSEAMRPSAQATNG